MLGHSFSRRDNSVLGRWWWTVDRWSLGVLVMIMVVGVLLSFAASPPVADRLGLGGFFFVKRHMIMIIPALAVMLASSLLMPRNIRRLAVLVYIAGLGLMVATILTGAEVKGARRWISLGSFTLQASEFVKPVLAVISAWMMAEKLRNPTFPGLSLSFFFMFMYVFLLILQPDFGMTIVTVATWGCQLFIAGIPLFWMVLVAGIGFIGAVGAYLLLPHVTRRVDQFLDPTSGDPKHDLYQITQSLEAFKHGGIFGRGPGEGIVKKHIPDAHADFVFAVAGEEFGIIVCLLIVGLFGFVVIRSYLRVVNEQSLFVMLATAGIAFQFGMQSLVNMASTLHIIPTKGMTMPFVSYGGSSMLALGLGMGIVLALTRKRYGVIDHL
ncbi:FtsW/RodA/SpoVE family cell cycle protein [Candidatus Odyssella acanthamoebae]|uniref:Probable peptidoglycan glycosyltransferase FtsW n=1 Tax=Candidatus Odyssella acanthamoebae TaxID=91604 RepID=A0A077ARE0_9PROT|nr:putative peptidoglycan glycosyltransferase FtsW [Candidatus Paracaedibacter acanthamoebae]AIK95762.1 cell division protein FtsW [Candidatus Paracaedibacter acanthamoebae]